MGLQTDTDGNFYYAKAARHALKAVVPYHGTLLKVSKDGSKTIEGILAWADTHIARTDKWPGQDSGPVYDAPGEKWANVNQALRIGLRGLPGGYSLAKLLREHRGAKNT
jgi:hypothetical protein